MMHGPGTEIELPLVGPVLWRRRQRDESVWADAERVRDKRFIVIEAAADGGGGLARCGGDAAAESEGLRACWVVFSRLVTARAQKLFHKSKLH